ncbi:hypothetical protein X777_02270 [Ooceraea biroi]|uniref:Uncharacterized protein n=1 Tax=Ooceraea biroi TaxID=2015173 RepID=A0A026WLZ3_OOCBI|nr:hypothetical protein X777_02270 [Ooceraea biroi]
MPLVLLPFTWQSDSIIATRRWRSSPISREPHCNNHKRRDFYAILRCTRDRLIIYFNKQNYVCHKRIS